MIRVTIELVPSGNESAKCILGVMHVANDGTGSKEYGNYKIVEMTPVMMEKRKAKQVFRDANIFRWLEALLKKSC